MRAVQGPGLQIQCLAQDWRDTEHTFQMVQGQLHQLESCLETGLKACTRVPLACGSESFTRMWAQGLRAEMHSSFREDRERVKGMEDLQRCLHGRNA